MVFYPDNASRSARVSTLANDIANLQMNIKSQDEKQQLADKRAYDELSRVAAKKGYATPKEYVDKSIAMLPKDQQDKIKDLRDRMQKLGKNSDMILTYSGIAATVGLTAMALLSEKALDKFVNIANYCAGYRALSLASAKSFVGATTEAEEAIEMVELTFEAVDTGAGAAAAGGAAAKEVGLLLNIGRWASRALVVASLLATIGGLIYDGVEGKKQMRTCQAYTMNLFAKRFIVMKMQEEIGNAFSLIADFNGLVALEDLINKNKHMSEEDKAESIKEAVEDIANKFADLPKVDQSKMVGDLLIKDNSVNAWLTEDPSHQVMETFIQAFEDKAKKYKEQNGTTWSPSEDEMKDFVFELHETDPIIKTWKIQEF